MSKFFKSILLLLSAGLFTATGWAVTLINPNPTASFTDFSTIPAGTTTEAKTLTNNGVTLTLPVGVTKNDDGTVNLNGVGATVGLSTPPSSATIVLDLAAAPGSGTIVSIPYKEDTGAVVSLKYDGTNLYTSWQNGGARQSGAWTAAATKVLFSNQSGAGTYAIADTVKLNDTGLHSSSKTISTIYIGSYKGTENSYMDLKIKAIYVYSGSKLTDMPTFTEVSAYERTIEGSEDWVAEDWGVADVTNPQEGMPVVLNVTGDATLTMNEAPNALAQLDIEGGADASLTITGRNKLTVSTTIVGANTTVDVGAANLGAVSIAEGKILTVKETPTNVYTSLGNYGALCLDGGDATTPLTINNNNALGKILLASGAVVKMTATGGNKVYNIEGVADAAVKPELRLHSGQDWGVTVPGSAFKNVKLVLPEKNNNDETGTYSFWLTPSTLANDASVDLEIKGGQGLTFENVNSVTAVFGSFVTNGAFSGTTVQTGTGEISGNGGTTNITVTNSGEGSFTVARAYGSSLTIGENGRVTVAEGGSLTGAVSVTGALTYATDATPTNTITNNGTITADAATVDLTGATITGSGTYGVTNGGTLILKAGTENGASVTSGTLKLLLSQDQLINGYTATVANGTVVTFVKAGAEDYETVAEGVTTYAPPAKDGETLTATVGSGDGQVMAWSGVGESGYVYKNTTLAIRFTANNQTFTFDNTLGVALTSLTVTAEDGVTGGKIALPATEGLVLAAATAINTNVTVTGQGALGAVTVAGGKALTMKTFAFTSLVKGEGEGNAIVTLDATDAAISHATAFTVPAGITLKTKGTVTLSGANTIASGAKLEVLSGTTSLGGAEKGLKGNISIAKDATLVNTRTSDALDYGGTLTVDVYGTLNMGDTRWTMGGNNTLNVYSGATITGNGQGTDGALDWYRAATFNVKKSNADGTNAVTISANLRTRDQGNIKFNIEEEMTATVSGVIRGNQAVTVNGAGTLTYAVAQPYHFGTLTVEGGTLRLDVNKGNDAGNYTQALPEGKVVTVNQNGILELYNGYGYFATTGAGLTKVTGDFYYGISGNDDAGNPRTNTIGSALEVTSNGTLRIRNWRTNYQLAPSALRLDGTIVSEGYNNQNIKDFTVAPAVLSGNGTIGSDTLNLGLNLPANATIDAAYGAVRVTGAVTLPAAMTVKITDAQNVAGSVTLLNAADVTLPDGGMTVTVMVGEAKGKKLYTVTHDADADIVKLTVAERTVKEALTAEVSAGGTLTFSDALGDYALAAEGATLIIDFGDKGEGDAQPGTFTFNNEEAITLTSITIQGTNGGTIVRADGAEIDYGTLVLNTTVAADAAFYAENTGAISGTGKLGLASGELTLDEANTYTGGTEIAAGAKLTITNAGAIGTGAITGAGTLVCDGVLPANKSGLTTGTPADGETPASGWLGTVWVKDLTWTSKTAFPINDYASNKSMLCLDSVTGTESYISPGTNGSSYPINICLKNNGWKSQNGNSGAKLTFSGALSGDGILDLTHNIPSSGQMYMFTGDISEFGGTVKVNANQIVVFGEVTSSYTSSKSEGQRWTVGESISPEGCILIAKPVTIAQGKIWTAKNGVMVLSTGTISGSGTIDSALTLADNATIDTTRGAVKVTGAVTLQSALTVKIAVAPTVGAAVHLLNASNVTIPDGMDVTVMVGDTPAEGTYQLIKTPTALLLENAPAEDVTIEASNIAAAELYAADQMDNYDSHGVQVDLDGPTPYAPGWVSGVCYPLVSVGVVSDADGRVAAGTCVQVVATDDPTVVVATSAPFQNENKEDVTVTSSNGTNTYKLYTFKFETPVYVDAAKTYQFRFVNGEGAAVTCKLRALYTSDANGGGDSQRYCNWLNANYEVITAVATRYAPYVVLTAERIVDNSPICRGGDETLEVTTVPEKIRLDTKTFGYGTHTVLQYTGGTTDWSTMDVEGLPEGAEIIKTDTTWGFKNHTLTVWPIGDSITAGLVKYNEGGGANWHVAGGYRLPLYQFLNQAGYAVNYVGTSLYPASQTNDSCSNSCEDRDIDSKVLKAAGLLHHEGHSGTTVDQLYARFKKAEVQTILAGQGTPDVITLHLGTNDFGGGNSVDTVKTEMKQLLYVLNGAAAEGYTSEDMPLYPNAKVLVAKIIPRSDKDVAANLNAFNEWLETYAAACPGKLILVDLGMDTSYTLLRHDGLHPFAEGYKQMARGWFAAIEKTIAPLKATATIATVDARVANTLTVTTNKAIDTSLTQTWTLDKGVTVAAAVVADDKRTVTLTVEGVVANTEYTLTATNLFGADDSVAKTFTTTADIHTPTTDVTETLATESASKLDGVTKAAEWTTFADFATGFTSPIGCMPESGRAWQLDVRGANVPTVNDGVLSLNGAPLTVNFVDGHIGNTSSTYTVVMTVSNLAVNDVLITESMAQYTNNGSVEGTPGGTNAEDAIQLKVKDTNTLVWGTTDIPVDVDLTDNEPDTIALSGKWVNGNNYSVAVNGGAKTALSVSGASQTIRDSWSIGALSTANEGSSMKLYRLSFYEGAATVVMPSEITTAIINVGEGAGQYITWETAKAGLNLADEMESLTINFTAADQTFTFDNTDAVTVDAVTVQGTAGGTIATAGTATVTTPALTINTSVKMNDDAMALTGNVAIAADCVLTYNVGDGMTVNATHSGAGSIAIANAGVLNGGDLEITKTCNVNVDVGASAALVVDIAPNETSSGFTKAFADNVTISGDGSVVLEQGMAYAKFVDLVFVTVTGTYTVGIGGTEAAPSGAFTPTILNVAEDASLNIRAYRAYTLAVNTVYVEGTIGRDGGDVEPTVTITADGGVTSYTGNGQINLPLVLEEGVLLEGETGLTVQSVQFPAMLKIDESALPTQETPVVLFKTTAFADATGQVEGVTLMVNDQATEDYILYKTAEAVELRYAPWTTVTSVMASGDVKTWSEVLADMEANRQRFDTTANPSLVIDFGNGDEPGTFTFDMGEGDPLDGNAVFTLGTVTIQGSAGGTIEKTGSANISANATKVNTNVEIAQNTMELGTTTLAANCTLTVNDAIALGEAANFAADATSTVKLVNVNNSSLDLAKLVPNGSNLTLNNVKAYIYDCTIGTLTLEGDFQMNNGTTNKLKTQCVTVNTLAGTGTFIGHQSSEVCIAVNVKDWEDFTGSIDLSHEKSKNTIFFFGTAPQRFTDAAGNAYDADDAETYFADDYGTVYVTAGNTVATDADSTWKLQKLVVETGASFQINGWATLATSCTGAVTVENGGVLDLRGLADLTGINVTVKAGGRLLVNTGATVPNNITFETGSILGVATKHVEDVGNATLTVNVNGTAATVPTIKGYHMDGVTELDNWAKNNETSSEGEFKFNFDPVFDGELCWWAYEFDNEVNTSPESNLGPISTGRDKGRMNFDGRGDSNRVCQDNEYLDHGDGTKAIRVASSPWRDVSGGYPKAFTAAMYGTLTSSRNRIIMGFGSSYNQKYTIALVTGASTDEVRLVLQKGWNENNQDYPEDAVITLATTTVPNANMENHLFAFSYEQFDSDADKTLDSTRIIFYVDGEKYQPFTAKAIIPLGNGFQMGSIHGGWHNSLTRMNGDDVNCTMEYLRIYDQILPESVWTAMSNEYSYMSKNGRATRTIVAGQDATWNEVTNEVGEWTQVRAVKNGEDYVLDAEGHVTFDNGTAVEKPDHGENVGTQVVLNVSGENTLYLNEFYSSPIQDGEVSKLYYERLEINPVEGGDEDSLTLWAGRLNPAIEEEDPLKNSQSAVINVQGYTKINTNVTMAHNVAFLSGPVAVAEGKWLHFDFSGFDVMKVPSMPVTYRLTGFLDEDTRTRVTSTAPAEPVNARSIDLGYKTTVNQYTFTVNRYPVTAYFTADDDPMVVAHNNDTTINFNSLYYIWQGNNEGKQMNWEAEAVDPQGNPIVENTLAKFVSLDAETQQEKMVTVTLATNDADPITLTLDEADLTKDSENMLGAEQLIVGDNVIVDYTGDDAGELAPFVKEAVGMVKAKAMTATTWRGNLTLDNGEDAVAIAGTNTISGKLVLGKSITLATAATLSAKDADFTAVKTITVDYEEAVDAGTYKVVGLEAGHTAKSLIGCVVTAVKNDASTVEWTEAEGTLVVVRADGLYVVARPDVKAGETVIATNDGLTLPLARRAAELSATSVSLTGVVNMAGESVDAPVADAAEVFTNVAFDMTETPVDGAVTAALKYDFGVSDIAIVTINDTQYVVAELIVSNHTDIEQNTAAYAADTTIDVTVKVGDAEQDVTVEAAANMMGETVAPAAELPASTRYVRFPMPSGNGTFEIKARASK